MLVRGKTFKKEYAKSNHLMQKYLFKSQKDRLSKEMMVKLSHTFSGETTPVYHMK